MKKENHHGHVLDVDKKKDPNPHNSSVVQALLDAIRFANEEERPTLEEALKVVNKNATLRKSADQVFQAHEYADEAIEYTKVATYTKDPGIFELTSDAFKILMLFNSVASQKGYIRLSVSTIYDITHIRRNNIIVSIKELIEHQYIAAVTDPPKGSKIPPVYLLDRRYLRNGHEPSQSDIELFTGLSAQIKSKNHISLLDNKDTYYEKEIITTKITDRTGKEYTIKAGSLGKRERPLSCSDDTHIKSTATTTVNKNYHHNDNTNPRKLSSPDFAGIDQEITATAIEINNIPAFNEAVKQ